MQHAAQGGANERVGVDSCVGVLFALVESDRKMFSMNGAWLLFRLSSLFGFLPHEEHGVPVCLAYSSGRSYFMGCAFLGHGLLTVPCLLGSLPLEFLVSCLFSSLLYLQTTELNSNCQSPSW